MKIKTTEGIIELKENQKIKVLNEMIDEETIIKMAKSIYIAIANYEGWEKSAISYNDPLVETIKREIKRYL
jgi:hypothetical protein